MLTTDWGTEHMVQLQISLNFYKCECYLFISTFYVHTARVRSHTSDPRSWRNIKHCALHIARSVWMLHQRCVCLCYSTCDDKSVHHDNHEMCKHDTENNVGFFWERFIDSCINRNTIRKLYDVFRSKLDLNKTWHCEWSWETNADSFAAETLYMSSVW